MRPTRVALTYAAHAFFLVSAFVGCSSARLGGQDAAGGATGRGSAVRMPRVEQARQAARVEPPRRAVRADTKRVPATCPALADNAGESAERAVSAAPDSWAPPAVRGFIVPRPRANFFVPHFTDPAARSHPVRAGHTRSSRPRDRWATSVVRMTPSAREPASRFARTAGASATTSTQTPAYAPTVARLSLSAPRATPRTLVGCDGASRHRRRDLRLAVALGAPARHQSG